jgi:NAD(P)-dependent dehydrogenase (short-subunit alcohol dehydrogenase family)
MSTTHRPVAVVTGASAGIGRATAVAFAQAGFDVALLARGRAGLEGAARDVEAAGGRAAVAQTDVADWHQVDAAADKAEAELGPIDVWVNGAMTTVFAAAWDVEPDEFRRATEVTYLGQVHGTLAALARMRPRDRGRVVNVGSSLSYVGIPLQSAYCAAKFACRGFFESVRAELLHEGSGVTISMVHLPGVNTPQFDWCLSRLPKRAQPVPPVYQPEVAAQAIVSTALEAPPESVLGSWNRLVIAAGLAAPDVVTRYAARTGVESQQADEPAGRGRASNLWGPVDDDHDVGAHGRFDDVASGVLHPSFLRTLPHSMREAAASAWDTLQDRLRRAVAPARPPVGQAASGDGNGHGRSTDHSTTSGVESVR